ncbi:MAG: porin family protein [Ferruginibacter sp.]
MKTKTFSLALIVIITSLSVSAQSFKIGIKGGADINKISGKSFKDEFSFGYHLGAFAEIGLTSRFGIQPEVLFSQVTADTSSNFSQVYQFNNISKIKLSYLKIPLLLNYMPNKFVSLQAGPQYGILIDQNKDLLKNGKDAFSNGEFSMLGGIQLNISKIRIYGRYAVGLNNINDIDDQEKWKNQTVQLGIGLTL